MKCISLSLVLVLAASLAVLAVAQDSKPAAADSRPRSVGVPPAKSRAELAITPEREAAVMTFVERNHVELKDLLMHLKENRRKDYERAVRELYRDAERISQVKDRDQTQYELELKAWTTKSKIQLLSARLSMGQSEELRSQIRGLLNEQLDIRSSLMKHERQRALDRVSRFDQELARLEKEREKIIENQLQVLTRSATDSKKGSKVAAKKEEGGPKRPGKKTDNRAVNQPAEKTSSPK